MVMVKTRGLAPVACWNNFLDCKHSHHWGFLSWAYEGAAPELHTAHFPRSMVPGLRGGWSLDWRRAGVQGLGSWDSWAAYRANVWCRNWYCSAVWIMPPLSRRNRHTMPRMSTSPRAFSCWQPMRVAMKQPVRPIPALDVTAVNHDRPRVGCCLWALHLSHQAQQGPRRFWSLVVWPGREEYVLH